MDFNADLDLFYADYGVDAIHSPVAGGSGGGLVIFDQPGQTLIGGDVLATDYAIRYMAASFPVVRRGDTFTIGGLVMKAREAATPILDGVEYTVPLARA